MCASRTDKSTADELHTNYFWTNKKQNTKHKTVSAVVLTVVLTLAGALQANELELFTDRELTVSRIFEDAELLSSSSILF